MLKSEEPSFISTKTTLTTTPATLKPIIINSNDILLNNSMNHQDLTKHSPSFLKTNFITSAEVNPNSLDPSTGSHQRRSPVSCQSVEEESVRSSSSRSTSSAKSLSILNPNPSHNSFSEYDANFDVSNERIDHCEHQIENKINNNNEIGGQDIINEHCVPPQYKEGSYETSAPAMRRRSLSKLRRRLSQTFRRSFGGSLADLGVQTFTIDEHEDEHSASLVGVSMNTGDTDSMARSTGQRRSVSEAKINGHNSGSSSIGGSHGHGLSVLSSSRLRTITNLTRKLSLSNSRILNSNDNSTTSSSTTRILPSSRGSHHHNHVFKASRSMNGIGVVHEHPRIGSDGESEEGSRTSEDVVSPANRGAVASGTQMGASVNGANRQQTNGNGGMGAGPYVGVKMRQKNNISANGGRDTMGARKLSSQEEINKRLSLPADLKLPDNFIQQQAVSPTLEGPLSRATRRQSLSEIGFGRMDTYTKLDKLGEGTYATVFKGKSRLTDNLVALKEIRLEHEEGAPCTAIREVSLLKDLKHNNIVTLHDIVHTDRALTLVFEYLEKDLKQYMDDCGGILSMNNVKIFLFQLIRGLGYCHSRRILHRDLKPQNLLINEMGELKLADFGLARAKSVPTKTYSNEVVTLWYRPPDVLLGSTEYSTPIDMWGVGCIFYEMASGRPLFPGSTVEDELHLIFKVLGTPKEENWHGISMSEELSAYNFPFYPPEPLVKRAPRLDQDGLDLVEKFLLFEAKKRISARNAMRHPYFGPTLGPTAIENLLDVQSIFTLPGVHLSKDPGYRSSAFNHASSGKSRRQSMLL